MAATSPEFVKAQRANGTSIWHAALKRPVTVGFYTPLVGAVAALSITLGLQSGNVANDRSSFTPSQAPGECAPVSPP